MPGHIFSHRSSISIHDLEGPNKDGTEVYRLLCLNSSRSEPQRHGRREAEPGPAPPHSYIPMRLQTTVLQDHIPETNILMQKTMIIYK